MLQHTYALLRWQAVYQSPGMAADQHAAATAAQRDGPKPAFLCCLCHMWVSCAVLACLLQITAASTT